MTTVDQARMNIIHVIMSIDDLEKLTQIQEKAVLVQQTKTKEASGLDTGDSSWNVLTTQQFLDGYSEEDSIYDDI